MNYDFETMRVIEEIKTANPKRVGLQFPEGLKEYAIEIASKIEEDTNVEIIIFTDPTYGACDIKLGIAEKLGLDMIIHYGHTEFKK